jgi:hypothetical protein
MFGVPVTDMARSQSSSDDMGTSAGDMAGQSMNPPVNNPKAPYPKLCSLSDRGDQLAVLAAIFLAGLWVRRRYLGGMRSAPSRRTTSPFK